MNETVYVKPGKIWQIPASGIWECRKNVAIVLYQLVFTGILPDCFVLFAYLPYRQYRKSHID